MDSGRARWRRTAVATVLAALIAAPAVAAAERSVPAGFFGANWGTEMAYDATPATQSATWGRMAAVGVESQRTLFSWPSAQFYGPEQELDFSRSDEVVRLAASHRVRLMPDVLGAPRWARSGENENAPPADREAYGHYLAAAIRRYGPHGTFWKAHPELPKMGIRDWQIWNEPCLRYWWHVPKGSDWAKSYAKLLKVAYAAAKKADGDVRIVLGGLVGKSWQQLEHLYEVGHVRGHFDMAAVHPYTAASHGPLKIVERFRKAMRRHGDGKRPLVISETTLPASRGRANGDAAFQTDDAGMASFLKATYRDFTKNRNKLRIARVYWYTWSSSYQSSDPFAYAGLVRYRRKDDGEHIREMPALSVYRKLALRAEGCRKDREGRCAGPPP